MKEVKRENIRQIVNHMQANIAYPYIAIRVDVGCLSTRLDKFLIENGFYPTSYLPYWNEGNDVIEYQYIANDKLLDMACEQPNKKEIINYVLEKRSLYE